MEQLLWQIDNTKQNNTNSTMIFQPAKIYHNIQNTNMGKTENVLKLHITLQATTVWSEFS